MEVQFMKDKDRNSCVLLSSEYGHLETLNTFKMDVQLMKGILQKIIVFYKQGGNIPMMDVFKHIFYF